MERHRIVIIGGGPAGLAFATRLKKRGINNVIVLEREQEAGGIPRHCGHWGFGFESHRRLMNGPRYASLLRDQARGVDLRTGTAVLGFTSPQVMRVQNASGISEISAEHIILATGARESSRASRLIGGARLPQVMNTGMLQQLVYLKHKKPFARPVIIGGEWVSFSALMTCSHMGIRPAAIILEEERIDAPWFFSWGARLRYGVPVKTATRLIAINGVSAVESVEVERHGGRETIACDGVIVSGKFVPEDFLLTDATVVPQVTLTGNVQGELKTAGRCVVEARKLADRIAV
jgi:NADPH-dependent 2,4-dienoyl-CoA reductase/sulfur reductase-like enzyme